MYMISRYHYIIGGNCMYCSYDLVSSKVSKHVYCISTLFYNNLHITIIDILFIN